MCSCRRLTESLLLYVTQVALGKGVAGFWTDDDDLAAELESIAKSTGDKSWRMPLEKAYNKQLESKIADISVGLVADAILTAGYLLFFNISHSFIISCIHLR